MALGEAVVAAGSEGLRLGLVATTFGFGFRHGIDWDHIAAIADITSSQDTKRRSMLFATLYALGHAAVVFGLGFAAIVLAERLPSGVDGVMERVVGVTLVLLGVYVFVAMVRQGRDFRMRSRWMLIFAGVRRGARWVRNRPSTGVVVIEHDHEHPSSESHVGAAEMAAAMMGSEPLAGHALVRGAHRHRHRHVGVTPDDPFMNYGRATAFLVGMIHGVGAETPTQVLIFLAAAGAGGQAAGVALLCCFLIGLLTSNTLVALASTCGFLGASRNFRVYAAVSIVTASFSFAIGMLFLLGKGTILPAIFGG
ncbi:MAG: High-affinity nickel transport protein [Acidimicrobiales bacterium]|jgi:cytochrome c biogenesis protein CcdA|nr:High-affinity nickel transport protein [Acidimicrobiales bacterium]